MAVPLCHSFLFMLFPASVWGPTAAVLQNNLTPAWAFLQAPASLTAPVWALYRHNSLAKTYLLPWSSPGTAGKPLLQHLENLPFFWSWFLPVCFSHIVSLTLLFFKHFPRGTTPWWVHWSGWNQLCATQVNPHTSSQRPLCSPPASTCSRYSGILKAIQTSQCDGSFYCWLLLLICKRTYSSANEFHMYTIKLVLQLAFRFDYIVYHSS